MDVFAVNNFGDTRSGGLAGPMGAFIILLMSIAVVLLIRNMNKRLRRLPDSFEDPKTAAREDEIARLEADLKRQGPDAAAPGLDGDRSAESRAGEDAQVNDVTAKDRRTGPDGAPGAA